MKLLPVLAVALLCGCAELPTVKACGKVEYKRDGLKYEVHFTDCRIQVEDSALGAAAGLLK